MGRFEIRSDCAQVLGVGGMTFTSTATMSRDAEDTKILFRIQKRLRGAFLSFGSWRKVALWKGVNHRYVTGVMQGTVPTSVEVRKALGFPAVMPSERQPWMRRVYPLMGTPGWEKVFFKQPRKNKK